MTDEENADISALEKSIQEKMHKLGTDRTVNITAQPTEPGSTWFSMADVKLMSGSVLMFGLVVIVLATVLLYKDKRLRSNDVLKVFGTLSIVIFSVFLIIAGFSDSQIAPVVGLLGTIAGYLLGRSDTDNNNKKNNDETSG